MSLITAFLNDDTGFIISAELVLIATIGVLGMIVGLSQVQNAVVSELNDVGHAIGALNQSYFYSGFSARKWGGWLKSRTFGSAFHDFSDACDGWGCAIACDCAVAECGFGYASVGGYGGGYSGTGTVSEAVVWQPATQCSPVVEPNCPNCPSGIVPPGPATSGMGISESVIPAPSANGYIPVQPKLIAPAPSK